MTPEQFKQLKPGDVIKHRWSDSTDDVYWVVLQPHTSGGREIAVRNLYDPDHSHASTEPWYVHLSGTFIRDAELISYDSRTD